MVTYDATTVKNKLGEVIEAARRQPVCVTKSGKETVYIISAEEYASLRKLEQEHWSRLIREAEATGYVGQEKSMELIKRILASGENQFTD